MTALRLIEEMMRATPYNRTARVLHWIVAALVLVQFGLGFGADLASRPLSDSLFDQHIRIGVLILALMGMRLLWRLAYSPPPLPNTISRWKRLAARATHWCLYALLFILPMSGYVLWAWIDRPLTWFRLFTIPIIFKGGEDETWRSIAGYTHNYAGWVLIALLLLHISAAIWHEFIARDRLISNRML